MFAHWIKSRRLFVAIGVIVVSWASFQTEGVASGEFLTDRIGEGSILHVSRMIRPESDGKILYFQDGRPVNLTQIKVDRPYCKFLSSRAKLGERLSQSHELVVRFKNVARARWFFDHGVELECMAPHARQSIRESDFHEALGRYFQVEKHSPIHPERSQWSM